MSSLDRVNVYLDGDHGGFRVIRVLFLGDYLETPLVPGQEDGDPPYIDVWSSYRSEIHVEAFPSEGLAALLDRATVTGRMVAERGIGARAGIVDLYSRFAAFAEGLPETIDRESYEASVRALGLSPLLDHEMTPEAAAGWPGLGRSCGHAAIFHDPAQVRAAAARLLDESRARRIAAVLEPGHAGPTP